MVIQLYSCISASISLRGNRLSTYTRTVASTFRYISTKAVRKFEDIPGPASFPVVGSLWNYTRFGEYNMNRLHINGRIKLSRYGPLVREEIIPGVNILWIFRPEDIQAMFEQEGANPNRRSHLALQKYRLDRPHIYNSGGLLPTNGEEWSKFRSLVQQPLARKQYLTKHTPQLDNVAREFVQRLSNLTTPKKPPIKDLLSELLKVYLELIGVVTFDARLGSLEDNLSSKSLPMQLIEAADSANSSVLKTDNGMHLWKRFETPLYKKLSAGLHVLERTAQDFVASKEKLLADKLSNQDKGKEDNDSSNTLLESFLSTPGLDTKDVVTMIADMLLAGIDTTAYSTSFFLYHMAKNPDKQVLLQKELDIILPNGSDSEITSEVLSSARFLKACIKESLRLNPVSVGTGRLATKDVVIGGHHVPQGTVLVSQNQVSCHLPEYFPQAGTFLPERWNRSIDLFPPPHPYVSIPFGHGRRACIGRRLAELNMQIVTIRLLQNFSWEWIGDGILDSVSELINKPDRPLVFNLRPRKPIAGAI